MEVKDITLGHALDAMRNCYQFENVNMYQHGVMVHQAYNDLICCLDSGLIAEGLPVRLIDIYKKHKDKLISYPYMQIYHIYHDIGKPYCRFVDDNGKVHYPDHADVSYEVFKHLFPELLKVQVMIKLDMAFHTLKPDQLKELAESEYGFSLFLTAWAEILANCQMFGGMDSVSFKIKRKHLTKCLKLFE